MKIEHIAIWVDDLEKMKAFYLKFFDLESNDKYINPKNEFSSYFLSFPSGARIELMKKSDVKQNKEKEIIKTGLAHFAISVGSKERVDGITKLIESSGFKIVGYPRTIGDGYYESVISDPEGNLIELTV